MFSVTTLLVLWVSSLTATAQQEWRAPREAAVKGNPIAVSADSIRLGQVAYRKNCAKCHGAPGAGDGIGAAMLPRKPKDLSEVLGAQSDGALFWKIRTGNEFMPAAPTGLTSEDTWHVINFVRSWATEDLRAHPWASFAEGAWVDVHTDHEMVMGAGAEPTSWASDSRMTVGAITADSVTIDHNNPEREISEQASVAIPAIDALAGVRALGQWPHDIFPFGPERESGVTPADKQPIPQKVRTEALGTERVEVDGKPQTADVVRRTWQATTTKATHSYVMTAWLVEGVELPVRWTLGVDGKMLSESELVSLSEPVKVGDRTIACVVTLTSKHLTEGVITKRRWSSAQVPGFLVKMESEMSTDEFSLVVNEHVTDFQTAAPVARTAEPEGNPPGARPALGFMPDYQSPEDGVLVDQVSAGGPAEAGGLQSGDLIVRIDGEAVLGLQDYMYVISELVIGKEVSVRVKRDGKQKDLKITVGER